MGQERNLKITSFRKGGGGWGDNLVRGNIRGIVPGGTAPKTSGVDEEGGCKVFIVRIEPSQCLEALWYSAGLGYRRATRSRDKAVFYCAELRPLKREKPKSVHQNLKSCNIKQTGRVWNSWGRQRQRHRQLQSRKMVSGGHTGQTTVNRPEVSL